MKFQDDVGRNFQLDKIPRSIVSLVPSQTELLADMGLQTAIAGLTRFCEFPSGLKKSVPIVGGTKNVDTNKIKHLAPDIILCNKEENTREMVDELEKIAPVHVSCVKSIEDNLRLIETYGKLFGREKQAIKLIERIIEERALFHDNLKRSTEKKVLYLIWKNPWMAAGGDTFINTMLEENKLQNVCKHIARYPQLHLEELKGTSAPDLIFLSSEPYPFKEKHKAELEAYFPESKILLADGTFFSWFGSRPAKAYRYFSEIQKQIYHR